MILACNAKESFHPHPDMPIYTVSPLMHSIYHQFLIMSIQDADNGHVKMVEDLELEIIDLR